MGIPAMHASDTEDRAPTGRAAAGAAPHLVVGLCTYRRRASLERLLEHVVVASLPLECEVTIIVVDNDGQDPLVAALTDKVALESGVPICYRIEPVPGISAARNLVFRTAGELGARFMAMIDDDEWPPPGWLVALLQAQSASGAVVVGGPVRPVFPGVAAHLRPYARYWSVDAQFLHGRPFVFCSCNFLVDLAAISGEARPLFDDAFGLSGGGDTVFFRKLFFAGHAMAWSEQAWISEEVPTSRATMAWMRMRRYRVGNHAVRWEQEGRGPSLALAKTFGLSLRLLAYPLWLREPESPWVGWLLEFDKVRGRWASHLGRHFVEYARLPPGGKACG